MKNADFSGVIAELHKLHDIDAMSVLIELAKLHNSIIEQGIDRIGKLLAFGREQHLSSRFHGIEESAIEREFEEKTHRITKITFIRKQRKDTESPWNETKAVITLSPKWNSRFAFRTFYNSHDQMLSHEYMDESTFFVNVMPKLQEFFNVEAQYA